MLTNIHHIIKENGSHCQEMREPSCIKVSVLWAECKAVEYSLWDDAGH